MNFHDPATIFILIVASCFVLDLLIGWRKVVSEREALFSDVRNRVLDGLSDGGYTQVEASELVDKLVAMAPGSSSDLGVLIGQYPRHEFDWTPCEKQEPHGWHPWSQWKGEYLGTVWCHGVEACDACGKPTDECCTGDGCSP